MYILRDSNDFKYKFKAVVALVRVILRSKENHDGNGKVVKQKV